MHININKDNGTYVEKDNIILFCVIGQDGQDSLEVGSKQLHTRKSILIYFNMLKEISRVNIRM